MKVDGTIPTRMTEGSWAADFRGPIFGAPRAVDRRCPRKTSAPLTQDSVFLVFLFFCFFFYRELSLSQVSLGSWTTCRSHQPVLSVPEHGTRSAIEGLNLLCCSNPESKPTATKSARSRSPSPELTVWCWLCTCVARNTNLYRWVQSGLSRAFSGNKPLRSPSLVLTRSPAPTSS